MKKILVANRGEIALRIMKSARRMGIRTVAIYSDADRNALHVQFADEAYPIGPAPSAASYLDGHKIIQVAKDCRADGIHPGYGFLSEQEWFAKATAEAGITFIGPSAESIAVMGDKLSAKAAASAYQIPMVPGSDGALKEVEEAKLLADKIGYPVLIKAAAGGGGKGMRIVHGEAEMETSFHRAGSEALASFGDGAVFMEKYVTQPRHIEVQILADHHGNILYLFERECSIQRRHQKVIEEAPSSVLTPVLRQQMGEAAVRVAQSCNYRNAGTVEFLLDANMQFYFLEMNTRLQVEHPVTEMITGLDLVEWQIRIARGEALPFRQSDLQINGHAIELRVYAEDPMEDFMPSTGTLTIYREPEGENIRVDGGYKEGMEIPVYYDPMISKLVCWGTSRDVAIQRLREAIRDYHIQGIAHNLSLGRFILDHEAFTNGNFDTHFLENYFNKEKLIAQDIDTAEVAGMMAAWLHIENSKKLHISNQNVTSLWSNRS